MITFRCETLAAVGSTNDVVMRRALAGAAEGLVVRALEQKSGRGRHGRQWASPKGNLYASILLRPTRPTTELASLSLMVGLSLADTLAELADCRLRPRLKWPNDVLVGEAKLAGILLESAVASIERPLVVAGIGVNCQSSPEGLPYPTTSLLALGVAVTPEVLLERLLARLAPDYAVWQAGGFTALRERWLDRAHGLGQTITVKAGKTAVTGQLQTVDEAGRLALETISGRSLLDAGELFFGARESLPCDG